MIRRSHFFGLAVMTVVMACTSNPVGRICDLGEKAPGTNEVVVASPSLDCVSRTCLRVPLARQLPPDSTFPAGNSGLCTAECESDSDCDRVPESPCQTGFTCGVAQGLTVGPFCCRKFCICKDYVVVPTDTNTLPIPMACDPANAENACCNLAGRTNNTQYPLCVE